MTRLLFLAAFLFSDTLFGAATTKVGGSGTTKVGGSGTTKVQATPAGGTNIVADLWQDFEFDGTVTQAALESRDHTALGSWSVTDTDTLLSTTTSGQKTMISTVNSTVDTGTRGLAFFRNTTSNAYIRYVPSAGKTTFSLGFWLKIPTNGSQYVFKVCFAYNMSQNASVSVVGNYGGGGTNRLYFTVDQNTYVPISIDTWYWVTAKYIQNSTCSLAAYNESGVQVGTTITTTAANNTMTELFFGSDTTINIGQTIYVDNIVIDWTSATFPLGP